MYSLAVWTRVRPDIVFKCQMVLQGMVVLEPGRGIAVAALELWHALMVLQQKVLFKPK